MYLKVSSINLIRAPVTFPSQWPSIGGNQWCERCPTSVAIGQVVLCHSNRNRMDTVHTPADDCTASTDYRSDNGHSLHRSSYIAWSMCITNTYIDEHCSSYIGRLWANVWFHIDRWSVDVCCLPLTPWWPSDSTDTGRYSVIHRPALDDTRTYIGRMLDDTRSYIGRMLDDTRSYIGRTLDDTRSYIGRTLDDTRSYISRTLDDTRSYIDRTLDDTRSYIGWILDNTRPYISWSLKDEDVLMMGCRWGVMCSNIWDIADI
jgi:hypothetical protein